jgi:glycosyltransferase involved in cell wall biosynthesis
MTTIPLGFVSNDRSKALAYSAADLFVLTSRAEQFGIVLIESLACGTPTVSFEVGGAPDIVRPGITGLLAEPENCQQLSERIVQLLEDNELRARMSHRCREIAVKEYSLDLYVKRHIALYRQTLVPGGVGDGARCASALPRAS